MVKSSVTHLELVRAEYQQGMQFVLDMRASVAEQISRYLDTHPLTRAQRRRLCENHLCCPTRMGIKRWLKTSSDLNQQFLLAGILGIDLQVSVSSPVAA